LKTAIASPSRLLETPENRGPLIKTMPMRLKAECAQSPSGRTCLPSLD
jgi:hypothetical protein